jgi:hypothetical protein
MVILCGKTVSSRACDRGGQPSVTTNVVTGVPLQDRDTPTSPTVEASNALGTGAFSSGPRRRAIAARSWL